MKLETLLKTFDYRITDGDEFLWKCYPNARFMSLSSDYAEISVVYSTVDQTVYEAKVDMAPGVDISGVPVYRWMNPNWKDAHDTESVERGFNPKIAFDDQEWVDLEVEDDFLTKARYMFDGKFDFDKRVQVEIDLEDDLFLFAAKHAHELDITFNEYVTQLLECELARLIEDVENNELSADWITKLAENLGDDELVLTDEPWENREGL